MIVYSMTIVFRLVRLWQIIGHIGDPGRFSRRPALTGRTLASFKDSLRDSSLASFSKHLKRTFLTGA